MRVANGYLVNSANGEWSKQIDGEMGGKMRELDTIINGS